jgi:hypothetical protein
MISGRPMTEAEWAAERATVIDASPPEASPVLPANS